MLRENLHEAFSIVVKTLDECEKSTHAHNFYELVYIVSGTGAQCINDQRFNYHAGHIFLLADSLRKECSSRCAIGVPMGRLKVRPIF